MTLVAPFGTVANVGDEVKFYDENGDLAFGGYIETKNITGSLTLYCEDYGSVLKHGITNKIYTDELPEDIIEDVVTDAGLTYVSTITTTVTIPVYAANKKNSQEIVEELTDRLLANYSTDVLKNFALELEGGDVSAKSLSNQNAVKNGSWEEDITELINAVYVEGDSRSVFGTEDFFNGTGSQTEFVLTEIPIDITVEHPVNTIKTGYVENQSTGDYTILREEKKIIFDTAPSSGTNNVKSIYTYSIPIVSRRRNKASIDLYGERNSIIRKNWILTRDDAKAYANFVITNFSTPLLNSKWIVTTQTDINDWQNFKPNELISVTDDLTSISGDFIIRKIERKYGTNPALKVTVGSIQRNMALWNKEVADRIRQLEVRDDNSTQINEDEQVIESLKVNLTTEIIRIATRSKGTAWILDDAVQSQIDKTFQLDGGVITEVYP